MSGSFDLARVALSAQQFRRNNLLQEQQETVYGQQQDDRAALRAIAPAAAAGDPAALAQAAAIDPQAAATWQRLRNSADDQQWQRAQRETEIMARYATGLQSRTPEQRAALWPQIRQEAQTRWGLQLGEAVPDDAAIQSFITSTLPAAEVWKYNRDTADSTPRLAGTAPGGQATAMPASMGAPLPSVTAAPSSGGPVRAQNANYAAQREEAMQRLSGDALAARLAEISAAAAADLTGAPSGTQYPASPGSTGAFAGMPAPARGTPILASAPGGQAPAQPAAAPAAQEGGVPRGYTPLVTGRAGTPYTAGLPQGYQWAQGPGGPSDRRSIRIPGLPVDRSEAGTWSTINTAEGVVRINSVTGERQRVGGLPAEASSWSTVNTAEGVFRVNNVTGQRERIGDLPPTANSARAGKLPANLAADEITDLERIGTASGIEADLASLTSLLDNGGLALGPIDRRLAEARLATNNGTPEDRNYATFKATLQNIANASLRLNKGVQTEGDAQRITAELVNSASDAGAVRQRLIELQAVNRRGIELTRKIINARRRTQDVPEMDASEFTTQPAVVGQGGGAPPAPPQATGSGVSADPPAPTAPPRQQGAPTAANLPRPSTPAEARALPPGTQFLTPDGRVATVPAR